MKKRFDVTGMTCSSCSSNVEKTISKIDGISSVVVNLLSNSMVVEYDENVLNSDKIIKEVEAIGYGAIEVNDKKKENKKVLGKDEEIKSMKKRLIISIIFLIPIMYIAMYHMIEEWLHIPTPEFIKNIFSGEQNAIIFAFTQFILLLPIVFVNQKYYKVGFKALLKRKPNMDSLIAIGSSAAIIYGIFAIYKIGYGLGYGDLELVHHYTMDIYFESAATILTLITLGKYLEAKSKGKTSEAIEKLIDLAPKTAIVIRNNKEEQIPIESVVVDDIIVIKPGMSIPVDGVIIEGNSSIDQSSITGESIPVQKGLGDNVISGTINKTGSFKFKAQKVGEDTTLSQIVKLVEEASNSKAPISKLADKISGIFVPIVIVIAIISSIIWICLGQSLEFALSIGIAVLVISCPCALGLATPVAIMVGTGKGAQYGILIKSAESLELLHSVDTIIFDKTGTITVGKPEVTDIISFNNNEQNFLQVAYTLEEKSEHPLAEAIIKKAKEKKIELLKLEEFNSVSGRGIIGKIEDEVYLGGNLAFMKENDINTDSISNKAEELARQGKTPLYFAKGKEFIGIIAVKDIIKEDSKQAIRELKKMKLDCIMLTGDNKLTAEVIKNDVGINNVISEVLPQEKEEVVSKIQKEGKKVCFVGDGINDSPALVRADVGIAIGSGTDIAIESADIVLMKDNLLDVVTSIKLSKNVIRNIKMNLFWAFFYNTIGIPLAAGVFYNLLGWKLNPMFGAAAMSLSSVCVVLNALRIKRFKVNYKEEKNIGDKYRKLKIVENKEESSMTKKTIKIEGMSCGHCTAAVENALNTLDGVESVTVSLEEKLAVVELNKEIDNRILENIITEKGYNVIDIK